MKYGIICNRGKRASNSVYVIGNGTDYQYGFDTLEEAQSMADRMNEAMRKAGYNDISYVAKEICDCIDCSMNGEACH